MAKTGLSRLASSLLQGIIANALYALVFGVTVTFIARYAPAWSHPVLLGLFASLLGLGLLLALKAIRNLPPVPDLVSVKNIEDRVRTWLYNTNLTVKRDPIPEAHFRFLVTTEGGKKICVGRLRNDWTDYLYFRSELATSAEERVILDKFTPEESATLIFDLRLELSRAKIGHSQITPEGFALVKRIPITPSLTEDTLINMVWEMEALTNSILTVSGRAFHLHALRSETTLT